MIRNLQIAVTALSLTARVLLMVLWARSHRTLDLLELYCGYGYGGHIDSAHSGMEFCISTGKSDFPNAKPGINYKAIPGKQTEIRKPRFNAMTGAPGVYFLQMPD